MADLVAFPARTGVVVDTRGEGRALRTTWHHAEGLVVLSVWRDHECVATVRVAADDVPALVDVLVSGLGDRYALAPGVADAG